MIEGILYFALGFFSAALIALMVSPAIWGRAVALTKKRVENSVPLTLNEIQADKDQLRAEFAMSTRRLEMSVEELREKASRQVIEIARRRDELAKIADESRERIKTIEELEIHGAELRAKLKEREEQYSRANQRLRETTAKLEEKAKLLETLQSELSQARDEADSSRIELVAKQTEMANLSDKVSDVSVHEKELAEEIASLREQLAAERKNTENELAARQEIESRLDSLQKQLASNEESLANRERDLARLRESAKDENVANTDLTEQLVAAQAHIVELEARLAQSSLQMEALLSDASNDNVEKAMASLTEDKKELEEQLVSITQERDRLKADLSGQARQSSEEWEVERRENAILRERINDLAAQVTAMTAALEGDDSQISKILAAAPKPVIAIDSHARSTSSGGSRSEETGAKTSLADRIRALQETARQNKAS